MAYQVAWYQISVPLESLPTIECEASMTDTIRCGSKDVFHNTVVWQMRTNRHTTCNGHSWGWIEGAPGNVCWSNDSRDFDFSKASSAITAHNQWLEQQTPIELRIVKLREKIDRQQQEVGVRRENLKAAETQLSILLDAFAEMMAIKEALKGSVVTQ